MFREKMEPLANSRKAAMATQTSHLPRITYEDCEERAREFRRPLLSEGRMDDGVSEERGERAENGGTMKYWEAVKKIKSGWNETKRVAHIKFKKEDGTWCETNKECPRI